MNQAFAPMTLEEHAKQRYPITFYPEAEGGYSVEIKDLPGCLSQGETLEEALVMIEDAKLAWIGVNLELGRPIPPPSTDPTLSVALPAKLHRHIRQAAQREGVTIGTWIERLLTTHVTD
jgi:antitoxin HicB